WAQGPAGLSHQFDNIVTAIPVPAAVWLFGSGLLGLTGVARYRR
ncbi:MAG: VPLPA-CTERM sorting domain-containing protein, partial [Gammaproteobacteria bacterium]|nr:VPLPA-CTERM sorting domain-containing protein [Gammaproteobacteria bacterium]